MIEDKTTDVPSPYYLSGLDSPGAALVTCRLAGNNYSTRSRASLDS